MSFRQIDTETGEYIRKRVVLDCSEDELLTEQHHKNEVNINNIVARHAGDMELIRASTQKLSSADYSMDDIPTNDFHEVMNIIAKAQQTFDNLPSAVREEFNYSPAKYMDYIHNPANNEALIERGWRKPPPPKDEPVQVVVTNQETPAEPAA